jgi:ABC-2 type transport system permease protein
MNQSHTADNTRNALAIIRLVAGREIGERLRSRLIWIMTALTTLLVVALIVIPPLIQQQATPTVVGLVGPSAQALGPSLQAIGAAAKVPIKVVDVANSATARSDLQRGSIDVALSSGPDSATAEVRGSVGYFQVQTLAPELQAVLQAAVDSAHQRQVFATAGVPIATVHAALAPVPFTVTSLQPPPKDQVARDVAALATGMLLYITLGVYGSAVATGVAQEKTSRMAEVLLAAVRPSQLLTGKVLGIGVCGVGQLAIAVVAGLIANVVVKSAQIPSTVWTLLPAALLWFALGYVLYAFAYAAAGTLVGRQEEVQFVILPITLPLVAGFLLTYLEIASPNAGWLRVLSFLPPLAPILMPARLALGVVAWWEMPVAVLIMVAAIYGMLRLAARIYAPALVQGGTRLSWGAALRLREH